MLDRHTHFANFALGEDVVCVIRGLGGQVEGNRQACLTLGEVAAIQFVGFCCR